jgi:hypothetical protein
MKDEKVRQSQNESANYLMKVEFAQVGPLLATVFQIS